MADDRTAPPRVFAPEAHLPPERRLLVDAGGVTLEGGLGFRQFIPWTACRAVLMSPDRAELVLDIPGDIGQVSIVVRAEDWHHGRDALSALEVNAPAGTVVPLPGDPEPVPTRYTLRGMATTSSVVLVLLAMSLALLAAIGLGIGLQDHRIPAELIGLAFGLATLAVLRSLLIRLHVPRRWRAAAAVRGRGTVELEHRITNGSDQVLSFAEPALYIVAGIFTVLGFAVRTGYWLIVIVVLVIAYRVRLERQRRLARSALQGSSPEGVGESESGR